MGHPFWCGLALIGGGARRGASGPLAHAKSGLLPGFPAKSEEPVVHSRKWATSSYETGAFPRFPAKSEEPVVHSGEWATSSYEIGAFPPFQAKSKEPVVHSGEWTTSSHVIEAFSRFSGQINGASGPLWKVDHWLAHNRGFFPVSWINLRN